MRTAFLLPFFALATVGRAQVFTSGFENWPDTVPSDWMGSKTTLSADSVEQVSTNTHGGSFAARLINTASGHKRFTTQPVTVTDGTIYEITFWVRGTGNVRTGLYDGRTSGSGYSAYNAYFNSTGDTWTEVTQQIACANDTDAAQFILSVQLTAGPEHLVVDDVNISSGGAPVQASVHDIQYTTDPNGASPLLGNVVITGGIVTGVDTIGADAYFIQSGTGPWSGLYVFDATNHPVLGDSVVVQGTVSEYQNSGEGVTELGAVTAFEVAGQFPVPAPQLLDTDGAGQEQWEGVLCVIANAQCTSLPTGQGEWGITQPSGDYTVSSMMYAYTPTVGASYDITGCIHYFTGFGFRIAPRFEADVVPATAIEESILGNATFGPNPVSDVLRINTGLPAGTRVACTFTDASGRVVRSALLIGNGTLPVNGLAPGLYHLTLLTGKASRTFAVQVR